MDRSEIDRWTAAGAQEIAPLDWRQAEREALRSELVDARRQRDALVVAATQAIDALRSGQILDWSMRDRVIAALAAAVGER